MSADSSSRGGRSRRGSRNRNRNGRRDGDRSDYRPSEPSRKPEPQGFFQKIIALFTGGGPKPAPASNGRPTRHPTLERAERAERAARQERPERSASTPRTSRKPEAVEVTSPKLYVGNLSYDAGESDLFELFKGVGMVQNAEIVTHRQTMRSKGFGFVTMQTVEEARRAVEVLHDKDFMGRKLVVSGAKTSDVRSASDEDSGGAAAA
jgi:hypothetical protein